MFRHVLANMTHSPDSSTTAGQTLRRLISACLALAMVATACGGSDNGSLVAQDSATDSSSDVGDDADGAEDTIGVTTEVDTASDDVADPVDQEEAMPAPTFDAPHITQNRSEAPASGGVDSGGDGDAEGLFSEPAKDDAEAIIEPPENSRLVDNRFTNYGYRQFIDAS